MHDIPKNRLRCTINKTILHYHQALGRLSKWRALPLPPLREGRQAEKIQERDAGQTQRGSISCRKKYRTLTEQDRTGMIEKRPNAWFLNEDVKSFVEQVGFKPYIKLDLYNRPSTFFGRILLNSKSNALFREYRLHFNTHFVFSKKAIRQI